MNDDASAAARVEDLDRHAVVATHWRRGGGGGSGGAPMAACLGSLACLDPVCCQASSMRFVLQVVVAQARMDAGMRLSKAVSADTTLLVTTHFTTT